MNFADVRDWSLHVAMSGMPSRLTSGLGARLSASMGRRTHPVAHDRAMRLFARLCPELSPDPAACEAAVDRLWANVGRTFAEFSISHRLLGQDRIPIDREDHLRDALQSGRPIVAIFPHLGNWEVSEMQIGFRAPHRVAVVVDPPGSTMRAKIAQRVRSRTPAELMPISRHVWRRALETLRHPSGILMLAIDEKVNGTVMGPSLGRPSRTEGNLGKAVRMALMTGALVMPFHSERIGGSSLLTRVLPLIELEGDVRDHAAVEDGVRRLNDVMTGAILRLHEQWYMAFEFRE